MKTFHNICNYVRFQAKYGLTDEHDIEAKKKLVEKYLHIYFEYFHPYLEIFQPEDL